jgi:mannose-6-phosphate isomerase
VGDCHIRLRATGEELLLREGNSVLIPAVLADYDVIPLKLSTRFLDAFIDNMDKSLVGKVTRFLHI